MGSTDFSMRYACLTKRKIKIKIKKVCRYWWLFLYAKFVVLFDLLISAS